MLPKQYRLSPKDFQRVYKNGFKVRGEFGMLIGLKEAELDSPKIGFVVNTKVGNAVVRHGMTRRLREISVKELSKSPTLLYEYIAFKNPEKFSDLEMELSSQFAQISKKLK
jgi:ribonuclease P protein component